MGLRIDMKTQNDSEDGVIEHSKEQELESTVPINFKPRGIGMANVVE